MPNLAETEPPRGEYDDGLPRRLSSPDGTVLVYAERRDGALRLVLRLPDHQRIALRPDAVDHPVLGRCDAIERLDGTPLALGSVVDWRQPRRVPALDRPGALPRGAGTAILNLLALQAIRAGSGPLRYHGPYPSPALWGSLMSSFRVLEPPAEALARFTADADARAVSGARGEIAVDFHADPHAWTWPQRRVCVQRRGPRIERVYVDGRPFDRDAFGPRRLELRAGATVASVGFGPETWCEVLRLDERGDPLGDPAALPPAPAGLPGTPLPAAVVEVLAQVVVSQAPPLLQPALRHVLAAEPLRWGPGPELVEWTGAHLELHGGLVAALPTDPTSLLGALVQLIESPLRRIAAAALQEAWSRRHPPPVPTP